MYQSLFMKCNEFQGNWGFVERKMFHVERFLVVSTARLFHVEQSRPELLANWLYNQQNSSRRARYPDWRLPVPAGAYR